MTPVSGVRVGRRVIIQPARYFSSFPSVKFEFSGSSRGLRAALPCVVTAPWGTSQTATGMLRALINPANVQLVGTALPYFPRGGPLPAPPPPGVRTSSAWGGMEAGANMLYPSQVVDGLTHLHAGPALRAALSLTKVDAHGHRCPTGCALLSSSFELRHFDLIAHTPTPYWPPSDDASQHDQWRKDIIACYLSSVLAVVEGAPLGAVRSASAPPLPSSRASTTPILIAAPLLGAGAKGAPVKAAAQCAAEAASLLRALEVQAQVTLRFVLHDDEALRELSAAFASMSVCI